MITTFHSGPYRFRKERGEKITTVELYAMLAFCDSKWEYQWYDDTITRAEMPQVTSATAIFKNWDSLPRTTGFNYKLNYDQDRES